MSFKSLEQTVVRTTISTLGDVYQYTPSGGSPVSINGVFSNAYVEIEQIVTLKPTLRINLADLTSLPAKGDAVQIDTVNYLVIESRLDGHGGSTLILKKA